jgi:hypothetical protein
MYLLEALAEGRYVQPCFLVDVHAPSVQGLYYGLGLREKKMVATSSTFSDSNVLNTMKGWCLSITADMADTSNCVASFHSLTSLLHPTPLHYLLSLLYSTLFPHFRLLSVILSANFFIFTLELFRGTQFHSLIHLMKSALPRHHPIIILKTSIFYSEVYRIISFFAFDGELLALAGGGVMPPIPPSVKAPKAQNGTDTMSESGASASKVKTKKEEASEKSGGKHYYGKLSSPHDQIRTTREHTHTHTHTHTRTHTQTSRACQTMNRTHYANPTSLLLSRSSNYSILSQMPSMIP